MEGQTSEGRAKGASQIPGTPTNMDAYRAELHGIYCILLFAKVLCKKYSINNGRMTIACDCDNALFCALKYQHCPTTSQPNYDILWSIHDLCRDLDITIDYVEVQGHQDTAALGQPLTRLERLNCETHARAKKYLAYVKRRRSTPMNKLYGNQWWLRYKDEYIYKD